MEGRWKRTQCLGAWHGLRDGFRSLRTVAVIELEGLLLLARLVLFFNTLNRKWPAFGAYRPCSDQVVLPDHTRRAMTNR